MMPAVCEGSERCALVGTAAFTLAARTTYAEVTNLLGYSIISQKTSNLQKHSCVIL